MVRTEPSNKTKYTVQQIIKDKATVTNGTASRSVGRSDLLVVKPFGEPVYPVLRSVDDPVIRSADKAFHTVINGENFHALQLLLFAYEGQVDCIYIDPPYNTGARDWKYNNDYVDGNDSWQHSKWLSFMEKRLRLARRLLKPDGVLVVTIDEHEVGNLSVLLAEKHLFGDARRQMITIVNNAAGVSQGGLWRVEEYACICWLGNSKPAPIDDDLLSEESKAKKTVLWFSLVRAGGVNATPARRPNLVFPIAVDPETKRVVGTGRTLKERIDAGTVKGDPNRWRPDPKEKVGGHPVVWPFSPDGGLYTWQMNPAGVMNAAASGFIRVRAYSGSGGNKFSVSYIRGGHQRKVVSGEIPNSGREGGDGAYILGDAVKSVVPKTVWKRARHDAGKWGSRTLRELLGDVSFDYAKSPYAVLDTLRTLVGDNTKALILDFFAGSGTTLHSVAMLNAQDDGRRRCVLVTNNQVDEAAARLLNDAGHFIGDGAFEARGICRSVTTPRIRAALTGERNGIPIPGEYQDSRKIADGFNENAAFFDLAYEDADTIEVGERFEDILPALWLAAGAQGNPTALRVHGEWFLGDEAPFAVLLDEDHIKEFAKRVRARKDLTHVWLVTDSEAAFTRMRDRLPSRLAAGMLYRDYLRNFRINTEVPR
jgi:adenine-specific DNA-methyltransferase